MKWQKEVFKSIEIDTSEPPLMFKNQLFSLTGGFDPNILQLLEVHGEG